jgi:hypothetical protein
MSSKDGLTAPETHAASGSAELRRELSADPTGGAPIDWTSPIVGVTVVIGLVAVVAVAIMFVVLKMRRTNMRRSRSESLIDGAEQVRPALEIASDGETADSGRVLSGVRWWIPLE